MRAKYPDRKVGDVSYDSREASITAYRVRLYPLGCKLAVVDWSDFIRLA